MDSAERNKDARRQVLARIQRHGGEGILAKRHIALASVLLFALWYRLQALASFVHPTYGNTMYHTGMARLISETGMMPLWDLSYGGFTRSFYVPAYRLFVASLSVLSNIDPMPMAMLATIAFGLVAVAAAYLLGREFGGEAAGLAAALLFALSPELTIYTIRPFPEVLGIAFFLLTLYFLKRGDVRFTVLSAVLTTLSHQSSAVALGAVLLVQSVLGRDRKSAAALIAAAMAYFAWQMWALGTPDILGMRQIALKEAGSIGADHVERIGAFALLLAPFGIAWVAAHRRDGLILAAFAAATLLLAKNEWFGVGIFMDRMFTFLALAVVMLAAVGAGMLWEEFEWK